MEQARGRSRDTHPSGSESRPGAADEVSLPAAMILARPQPPSSPSFLKRPYSNLSAATATTKTSSEATASQRPLTSGTVAAAAVAASATTTTSAVAMASPGGKRPYIRTRRPHGYDGRSTVTTVVTTFDGSVGATKSSSSTSSSHPSTAAQGSGAIDAVLGESSDLLTAAHEAQQLGRYKMASTYLLLLHARLVGLGRRFDKATLGSGDLAGGGRPSHGGKGETIPSSNGTMEVKSVGIGGGDTADASPQDKGVPLTGGEPLAATSTVAAAAAPDAEGVGGGDTADDSPQDQGAPLTGEASPVTASTATTAAAPDPAATNDPLTPQTRAAKTFARLLPRDIELDQAMMEHLARAAVELHAARSGKKKKPTGHSHTFRSPDPQSFWATTANQRGVTTAATRHQQSAASVAECAANPVTATQSPSTVGAGTSASASASAISSDAATTSSTDESAAAAAAAAVGGCGIAWTDQEIVTLNQAVANGTNHPHDLAALLPGKTDRQIKLYLKNQTQRLRAFHQEAALDTLAEEPNSHHQQQPTNHQNLDQPNKSGWSSRKPATAAMNTVPNAVCDVRALLAQADRPSPKPSDHPIGTHPSMIRQASSGVAVSNEHPETTGCL